MESQAGLAWLGRTTRDLVGDVGGLSRLAWSSTARFVTGPWRGGMRLAPLADQAVRAGVESLGLVALICILTGMITALQSAYQLQQMGASMLVADLVAISMTRELAPLLTAVIVAGRFGSSIAAELGTMKVSEEIDALEVMGIDPLDFLVVPRLVALLVTMPCLVLYADVMGIFGGFVVATGVLDMGWGGYLGRTMDALVLQDIYTGLVKAVVFAGIIGIVGCYQGITTRGGAEEVGRSTTTSVVRSIVLIVMADLFVTAIFYLSG